MQIKIALRFYLTLAKMFKINKMNDDRYWEEDRERETLTHLLLRGAQTSATTLKISVEISQKLRMTVLQFPGIPLLGILYILLETLALPCLLMCYS